MLWWSADEWGVPKLAKIPTADLLLGVGLLGLGQVSLSDISGLLSLVFHHCYRIHSYKAKMFSLIADTQH